MVNKQQKPSVEVHAIMKLVWNKQNRFFYLGEKKVRANYGKADREQSNESFFI